MKLTLRLEELSIFFLCILLFSRLNFEWWWFPVLLLLPDIGMLGYIVNSRIGAFTYNLFHYRFVAAIIAFYALTYGNETWKLIAIILFAHISLDRSLGYGLKHTNSFHDTHLGLIGKQAKQ